MFYYNIIILKHRIMDDNTITPYDSIELVNTFIKIYNKTYRKTGNMFENIDIKDPLSTNDKTELFYTYMKEYSDLQQCSPNLIDVYEPDTYMENKNDNDIYGLITDIDKKLIYKSLSYISLLFIGYKTIENNINWGIVKL